MYRRCYNILSLTKRMRNSNDFYYLLYIGRVLRRRLYYNTSGKEKKNYEFYFSFLFLLVLFNKYRYGDVHYL